jgi:hypothetical protein
MSTISTTDNIVSSDIIFYVRLIPKDLLAIARVITDLTLEQREKIWELIEQFFRPKTSAESVTQIL